uniref:Uncharacterized protein n=1 Tax=Oryza brachyantha TaxID=4533 RepID=J3LW85_ORYBR
MADAKHQFDGFVVPDTVKYAHLQLDFVLKILVHFCVRLASPSCMQSADIEGDLPFSKRLKRIPSDVLQDVTSVEELPFQNNIAPNNLESAQKISYVVRDALINVGPLKDFSYGLRGNADPNATGNAKQSNYELHQYYYNQGFKFYL